MFHLLIIGVIGLFSMQGISLFVYCLSAYGRDVNIYLMSKIRVLRAEICV